MVQVFCNLLYFVEIKKKLKIFFERCYYYIFVKSCLIRKGVIHSLTFIQLAPILLSNKYENSQNIF